MKFRLTGIALILILLVAANSNSQNIPNPGFENWITPGQTEEPEFWITNNAANSISVSKSSDSHTGTFALKVINNGPSIEGPLPGYAVSNFSNPNIISSLSGFVKCDSISGTGEGRIMVFGYTGSSMQQIGSWQTVSVNSSFTPFNIPLTPLLVFDSINVQIEAYAQMDPLGWPTGYASLLVDDLSELILSDGDEIDFSKSFALAPNPFTDFITISKTKDLHDEIYLEVFDSSGKLVFSEELNSGFDDSVVSIKMWPRGKYVFVFRNRETSKMESLSAVKM